MRAAGIMVSALRARGLSRAIAAVCVATCCGCGPRTAPDDAAAGTTLRCVRRDVELHSWLIQGRLVSDEPMGFVECLTHTDRNPCGLRADSLSLTTDPWRTKIQERDEQLRAVHHILSTQGAAARVEVVVVDGFYCHGGSSVDYGHATVFTCSPRAQGLRAALERLGAKYATRQQMAAMRPAARQLVSEVLTISITLYGSEDVLLVSYYDGRRWYSRPWFYVDWHLINERPGWGPYRAAARLMGVLFDDLRIRLGRDRSWGLHSAFPEDP